VTSSFRSLLLEIERRIGREAIEHRACKSYRDDRSFIPGLATNDFRMTLIGDYEIVTKQFVLRDERSRFKKQIAESTCAF